MEETKNIEVIETISSKAQEEEGNNTEITTEENKEEKTKMNVAGNIKVTKTVTFKEPQPINKSPDDSEFRTRVIVSSKRRYIKRLRRLKSEIYNVIRETEGVWCNEVVTLYRLRYGKFPDFDALNFANIVDVLYCMKDQLQISRPKGYDGLWVCDAKAPRLPPPKQEPEPEVVPQPVPDEEVPWWEPCPPEPPDCSALEEDALPGVSLAPDVFPLDCMQPWNTIPNLELPKLESEFLELRVFLTAFYSPSHLWLRFADNAYDGTIEEIIDEMTEYYEKGEGVHRRLSYMAMKVGQYCAAFNQYWLRAVIVRIVDRDHAKVLLVDHGLVKKLSIEDLKPLHRKWSSMPAQVVRARQVGVRPPSGNVLWPRLSCLQFDDQIRGRVLMARVLSVDKAERVLEVKLRNLTIKERIKRKLVIHEGIDQGMKFIETGFAEPEPYPLPESSKRCSYYYPLFEVLESGATPSLAELEDLYDQGFEPEEVPSFLKHVPLTFIPCVPSTDDTDDFDDFISRGPMTFYPAMLDPVTSGSVSSDSVTPGPERSCFFTSDSVPLDPETSGPVTLDSEASCLVTSDSVPLDPEPSGPVTLDSEAACLVTSDSVPLDPEPSGPVTLDSEAACLVTSDSVPLDPEPSGPVTLDSEAACLVTSDSVPLDPEPSGPVTLDSEAACLVTSDSVPLDPEPSGPVTLDSEAACLVTSDSVPLDPEPSGPVTLDSEAACLVTSDSVPLDPEPSGPVTLDSEAACLVTSDSVPLDPEPSGPVTLDPVTSNSETSATSNYTGPLIICKRTYVILKTRKVAVPK